MFFSDEGVVGHLARNQEFSYVIWYEIKGSPGRSGTTFKLLLLNLARNQRFSWNRQVAGWTIQAAGAPEERRKRKLKNEEENETETSSGLAARGLRLGARGYYRLGLL